MTNEVGDPVFGLATRVEKAEHDIQNIYGKLMRAFVGSRIVAGNITGVLPPGVDIGPTIISLLNNSGGSLADGDVVVLDIATGGRRIKTTTTAGDPHILGVVRDVNAVGTFANGSETPVQIDGYVASLKVTGAVAAGAFLRTSTTVKLAVSAGAVPSAGVFARALSADAAGVVEAEIYGADLDALSQILTAKGDLLVATAAGIPDNLPVSGNDGRVLTEDSGDPFGMSWQAAAQAFDIEEADGSPSISSPTQILTPNGTLSQPSAGVAVIDQRPVVALFDATGLTDGAETSFETPDFFVPDSVMVWEDGLMLRPVVDYVENADFAGVTLASAPPAATALLIRYEADQS